ncbi:hypothetical protein [Novosphingobium fuchskuhlense]|uniref:hypothetical protein n=1 Tax=Novosphingobium fuchskuhlense TaxID=1117702 RepID=UPI000B129C8F|nr:hypothetical protein [Novosphingobium fuchskuhlense]
MTPDKFVALIGIAMALVLALGHGELRRMRLSSSAWMAAAWVLIIVVAAVAFAGYHR